MNKTANTSWDIPTVQPAKRGKTELTWANLHRVYRERSETGGEERRKYRRGRKEGNLGAWQLRQRTIVLLRHLQLREQIRGHFLFFLSFPLAFLPIGQEGHGAWQVGEQSRQ